MKIEDIFTYFKRVEEKTFDLDKLIKTRDDYRSAYRRHQKACDFVIPKVKGKVIPLGEIIDYNQEVFVKTDKPDYLLYRDRSYCLFDVKYKSKPEHFGWINTRAYQAYKRFSLDLNLPVYVVSTNLDQIGHFSVVDTPLKLDKRAWNGNRLTIFEWKDGLF